MSVGIPTSNRLIMLRRAVASVLAQDYPNVEVVISDNASTDGTQAWCEGMAKRDSRVRYTRQSRDRGASANFAEVFKRSHGSLYMVIGDDDWLEPTFVSRCSEVLLAQSDLSVVCGAPRMVIGEDFVRHGRKINLLQTSAFERVARYLWQVTENVTFHGLMRREMLAGVWAVPNVPGNDWLLGARLAFMGKIRTLDDTAINKSVAGTTGSWAKIIRNSQQPSFWAKIPYPLIVGFVFADIAWGSPAYAPAGQFGRMRLACIGAVALLAKFSLWSVAVLAKGLWNRCTARPFPLRAG